MDNWDGTEKDLDRVLNGDKTEYSDEEVRVGKLHELHMLGETDIADEDDISEEVREEDEQALFDQFNRNQDGVDISTKLREDDTTDEILYFEQYNTNQHM